MDAAVDAMMGDHSAKGRLQSGATIIAALGIFEEHSSAALDQTLAEAAKIIEHRGKEWTAAMLGISEALDDQLSQAHRWLETTRRVADRANSPSVSRAIDERVMEIRTRLHEQHADFRDGWTAPVPKWWKDRHPLLYQIMLLLVGAVLALAASLATGLLRLGTN